MRVTQFLSASQVETIHRNALRVLAETGVLVEHEQLLRRLETAGGSVDSAAGRIRFAPAAVERRLFDRPRAEAAAGRPSVRLYSGVYQSRYLAPETGDLTAFDETTLAFYFALARSLPRMSWLGLLGLPFAVHGLPAECAPLLEKLFAWKNGVEPCGSVLMTAF